MQNLWCKRCISILWSLQVHLRFLISWTKIEQWHLFFFTRRLMLFLFHFCLRIFLLCIHKNSCWYLVAFIQVSKYQKHQFWVWTSFLDCPYRCKVLLTFYPEYLWIIWLRLFLENLGFTGFMLLVYRYHLLLRLRLIL